MKICKEYLADVKVLLPVKRKKEREFIKRISTDVVAFCEESGASTKEELYEGYGKPNEIVSNYILTLDDRELSGQLSVARFLKTAVAVLLVLAVTIIAATGVFAYSKYQLFLEDEATITEYSSQKPVYVEKLNPIWFLALSESEQDIR